MSKPDDMPQDVWDVARRIWAEMLTVNHAAPQKHSFNDCDEIARAILAERERCLAIANGWLIACADRGAELKFTTPQEWANGAVEDIAELIQSGAKL